MNRLKFNTRCQKIYNKHGVTSFSTEMILKGDLGKEEWRLITILSLLTANGDICKKLLDELSNRNNPKSLWQADSESLATANQLHDYILDYSKQTDKLKKRFDKLNIKFHPEDGIDVVDTTRFLLGVFMTYAELCRDYDGGTEAAVANYKEAEVYASDVTSIADKLSRAIGAVASM